MKKTKKDTKKLLRTVKFGLQGKVTVLILFLFLLPFSLIGLFFYSQQTKAANKQVFLSELNTLNSIGLNMEQSLSNLQQISLLFYQNNDFQDFLHDNISVAKKPLSTIYLNAYFTNLFSYDKSVSAVTIRRMDGISYSSSSSYGAMSGDDFNEIMNQSGKMTYMGMRESSLASGNPAFVFSRKLYDLNNMSHVLGAIEFFVEKDVILSTLTGIDSTTVGKYYIFSNDFKDIVYTNTVYSIFDFSDFDFNSIKNYKSQKVFFVKIKGRDYIISLYPFSVNPKWILVHVSTSYFMNRILILWVFLSIILGCLVSVLFYIWLNKHIFERLNLLALGMKKIEEKNYSIQIPVINVDEISVLTQDFNHMSCRLEEMINQVYIAQLRQNDSEIKSLRAYINPHFLFNTLDTICWMSRMENAYETCSLVESLSHLFRKSLVSNKGICTVEEEISYTKEYLKIQECRYSDRIDFEIYSDSPLNKFQTISSVLQPLIENAIIHGFKDQTSEGKISITILEENGHLIFKVENNGMNGDINELNKILIEYKEGQIGMALFGVHNRIQLRFGSAFGLSFKPVFPHGLLAIVEQPLILADGGSV